MRIPFAHLCAAAFALHYSPALADDLVLDLPTTLTLAAAAPDVRLAEARIAEAEAARALTASRNPEVSVSGGPRFGDARTTDLSLELEQSFVLGRPTAARGELAATQARRARDGELAQRRTTQLAAALAYFDALHATLLVAATEHATELAQRAADTAQRRRKAGDITDLDVDLARAALGRARSQAHAAAADRARAIGALARLLGIAGTTRVVVKGDLASPAEPLSLATLARSTEHPDTLVAQGERDLARAEGRVTIADRAPALGVWLGYQHEEGADIVLGGLRFELPVWQRARGERAVANARVKAAEAVIGATRTRVQRELVDTFEEYTRTREALATFEADVLPALDDAEQLLGKSLDAGQISVADFLVVRTELLDGRREHLERLLAHAKARITAIYTAGAP